MSVNKVNSDGTLSRVAGGTLYADLPIGSWIKNDSDTIPSGFLKAGDTISQTLYPELYAMYGSTVPYKADTSELSDYEDITFPASLLVTAQYDGVIITTAYDGGYLTFNINDNKVYIRTQSSGINAGTATVPIRKGDVISVEGADGGYAIKVRYYKKSLIVKAKQVAVPADFKDAIDDALSEFAKPITLQPLNGSTIYYNKSRIVGGIVTVCADIIVQSGSSLTKENAIANVPNLGTASVGYILPCLYRNTSNGLEEPSFAIIQTGGNLYPYYTKTEYNEIRINTSYSSKI